MFSNGKIQPIWQRTKQLLYKPKTKGDECCVHKSIILGIKGISFPSKTCITVRVIYWKLAEFIYTPNECFFWLIQQLQNTHPDLLIHANGFQWHFHNWKSKADIQSNERRAECPGNNEGKHDIYTYLSPTTEIVTPTECEKLQHTTRMFPDTIKYDWQ